MNYLISTSFWNKPYSHIVKGLESADIQTLFNPVNLVPIREDEIPKGYDLIMDLKRENKSIQIITQIPKVVDFYEFIQAKKDEITKQESLTIDNAHQNWSIWIEGISSLSKPLTRGQSDALLQQLATKYTEKTKTITPKVLQLVEEMKHDVADFNSRFSGYIEEKDLDALALWSEDMQKFAQQGRIESVKSTMTKIVEKMEVLESNYVKTINMDTEKPLEQFNHELHTIMNQNRLFRQHGLNQLSGWSNLNYILFRISAQLKLIVDAFGVEFADFRRGVVLFLKTSFKVIFFGLLLMQCLLYIIKSFVDKDLLYPLVGSSIIALVIMLSSYFLDKKWYVAVIFTAIITCCGYAGYQLLAINFWL